MPCVVDLSRISTFAYTRSYTCIRQLFHISYHVKVIDSYKQDVWVSRYKNTDPFWPYILRNTPLQQSDHRFRYLVYFFQLLPSVATMALHRSVTKHTDILCELYEDIYSEVADDCEN
jgi:hypothetical protein